MQIIIEVLLNNNANLHYVKFGIQIRQLNSSLLLQGLIWLWPEIAQT